MQIELASVDDAGTVADRWVELADEQRQYGSHLLPEATAVQIREEMTRRAATDALLVARDEGIVGFVAYTLEHGTYERELTRGIVENLYVDPERRGEGIGSELLAAAEEALADAGADVVALEAMADNDDAQRFYRRHGYESHRVTFEKPLESDNLSKEGG